MKTCPCCKLVKSFENFGKLKSSKDGHFTYCKSCKKDKDYQYSKSESGKNSRRKARKKYKNKPEVKKHILELKRKTYIRYGLYHNKFCELYKNCTKCKIEKSWLEFRINKKNKTSRRSQCRKCESIAHSLYSKTNKEKVNKARALKTKNNPIFKLRLRISCRVKEIFRRKNFKKNKKYKEYIGCTPQQLYKHITKQFKDGMSWDNYGINGWHIDHIIPLCLAKTEEDVYKLSHYSNLQPLWAEENLKKGGKYEAPII